MKRLDEILAKRSANVTSAAPWDTSSATAEPEPDAACPVCGGAGFVRRERALDDPLFGRAEPCDCVLDEQTDARRSRLQRISNLGALARFTFASLLPDGPSGDRPWFPPARQAALDFAAEPEGFLVFAGPSGSGKTHLAAAIANARVDDGDPALFMVVPDLLDHLRAGYADTADDDLAFAGLFDQVRNAPLLLLDDIDAASPTPWAKEKLFQVVNHRANAALPTVFTCSGRAADLDERLATRLFSSDAAKVVRLGGARGLYREVGGMTRERLAEMDFRDFDLRLIGHKPDERETIAAAFGAAREFADNPTGWLTLTGPNGVGKTHLAAAIANRALSGGTDVYFAVVPDLLDQLRSSYAPGNEAAFDETFEAIRTASLLVLDDLGAQVSSPWAQEKLYQVVNYRTLSGLATVVTTCLALDELTRTHTRIASRIFDVRYGAVVAMVGPHYRLGRLPGNESRPASNRRSRQG